jgi:hypothetical protein
VRVGVRDQGVRIAEPDQQRIFEKFVRLDPNLTSGVSGTVWGAKIRCALREICDLQVVTLILAPHTRQRDRHVQLGQERQRDGVADAQPAAERVGCANSAGRDKRFGILGGSVW